MTSLLNRVKNVFLKGNTETALLSKPAKESNWRTVKLAVDADWANSRLDRLLTKKFDISASLAQKLIRTNKVWIERPSSNSKLTARSGLRVELGDSVNMSQVFLPERKLSLPLSADENQKLAEWTIAETDEFLVLSKPSGITVHGANSIDSLLQRVNPEYRLIHRLDKGTSGVLLIGKTRSATEKIQNLFAQQEVKKTYLAMVAGVPKERSGRIQSLIFEAKRSFGSPNEPQMTSVQSKRADLMDEGKVAVTDYRMISTHTARINGVRVKLSLLEFKPITGRTHQLRVHAAEQLGCPIVGDSKYGLTTVYNLSRVKGIGQALHLHCKSIQLPDQEKPFESSLPKHFAQTLQHFPLYIKPPRPQPKRV